MSNDRLREEMITFFVERFGVDRSTFDALRIEQHGDDVWAASESPPPDIPARRPTGLRILRRTPKGPRPTSSFLILLADRVTGGRIELGVDDLKDLLLGRQLAVDGSDGHVALAYHGDVVGCGHMRRGMVRALIPTGRRRELLEAVADEASNPSLNL